MRLNAIIHELHRKYDHTYIFTKVGGKESLAFVDSLTVNGEGDKASGEISLTTKDYGVLKFKIPTSQELLFRLPKARTFQRGRDAYSVFRRPARQWQRGITPDNTTIVNMTSYTLLGTAASAATTLTLDVVNDAFFGETYSPRAAVDILNNGKVASVAIEGNWCLVLSPTTEHDGYLLYFKLLPVARIDRNGRILRVFDGAYHHPVQALFGEI